MRFRPGLIGLMLATVAACRPSNGDVTMHPVDRVLTEQVRRGRTPGLQYVHFRTDSVVHRFQAGVAEVTLEKPVTPSTTFNGFSVTKTFTAVAVLQLVERGLVELDRPAVAYLPDFPYGGAITIRNLLTHSAGIPNPIPLRWTHLEAEHAGFDRDAFFRQQFEKNPRVASAPNARFAYTNLGYQILGQVIEAVTGTSYEQYVTGSILNRIGVTPGELGFSLNPAIHARGYHKRWSLTYPILGFLLDRSRALEGREGAWQRYRLYYMNGAAYGGLIGTADGFARFGQALLDEASPLLSAASRATLFTENVLTSGEKSGMSLSWFVNALDGEPYFDHAGGGGGYYAELRLYPRLRRGSVLLLNRTGLKDDHLLDAIDPPMLRDARGSRH